ncbi:hypothetical protein V5799_031303 [Amblyomma americanum]|uniref:Uncharacterized protein n=1 Tax=Amblyomma americanum TaxID=6943 RepID=A0AAQ4EKT4_AMBAM
MNTLAQSTLAPSILAPSTLAPSILAPSILAPSILAPITLNQSTSTMPLVMPEKAIEKINKMKKLEIETSTKLTNLTSRNMDVSSSEVLRKFKVVCLLILQADRSHGQQFQKDFDEATQCLEEYIKALEKEVAERTELIKVLEDAKVYYDSQNGEARVVASVGSGVYAHLILLALLNLDYFKRGVKY